MEAGNVTTPYLQKKNYNNAAQAPLESVRLAQLFMTQTATCISGLYFQTAGENKPCKKTILLNHNIPILRRHDTIWIIHFPQQT